MNYSSHDTDPQVKEKIMREWTSDKRETKTIISFCLLTIFFTVLGAILAYYTSQVKLVETRYDNQCALSNASTECTIDIVFDEELEGPVYFYYELHNFFQNHRTYLNSKDLPQLNGEIREASKLDNCGPVKYNRDLYAHQRFARVGGAALKPNDPANPCGLIARSLFNDTYKLMNSEDQQIEISEEGIAWESDKNEVYKYPANSEDIQWTDVRDEHFMVWMRPAGLSNFRKLWGIIRSSIEAGTYKLTIKNYYDVNQFDGKKLVVFQTVNAFGGKNLLLTVCYFIAAAVCLLISIYFIISAVKKRKTQ